MKRRFLMEVVPTIPSDLVSVKEGARIARKRENTIWRDIRTGKLRAWGTRRCYRISVSELLAPVRQASRKQTNNTTPVATAAPQAGIAEARGD
jgi:hypothetical protein